MAQEKLFYQRTINNIKTDKNRQKNLTNNYYCLFFI